MCIEYEEMKGYLHHYARKYENKYHEKWELISEAWIAVHNLNEPKYLSNGIRWAMKSYRINSLNWRRRGNPRASIVSLDNEMNEMFCLKDCIFDPLNQYSVVDNADEIKYLGRNITLKNRLLLDQRYYQGLTLQEIGLIHSCTKSMIKWRLDRILEMLKQVATKEVA